MVIEPQKVWIQLDVNGIPYLPVAIFNYKRLMTPSWRNFTIPQIRKKNLPQLHGMLANIEKTQHHSTLQISYTFAIVVWNDS